MSFTFAKQIKYNKNYFLYKNRNQLQYMLKIQVKNNIENMPTEVQKVSYKEELKAQKEYLKSLYEPNKLPEQEPTQQNEMKLGRFRKKRK